MFWQISSADPHRIVPLSKGLPGIRKKARRSGIDLFATALNHQTPVYISPCPDPNALALDALIVDWSTLPLAYVFPPMPIGRKSCRRFGSHRSTSYWWLRRGRRSPGFRTYSIFPWQLHSRFGCSRPPLADGATHDLDAPQPRNVQLPRLDVVRDSLKASDCRQNCSPTMGFYQIHL